MDYYDIDSILAEEEKLKVKFPCDIENFGFYIGPRLGSIKKGIKADVPLFLIQFLIENECCTVVTNPVEELRNALEANPAIVSMENRYFYTTNKTFSDRTYLSRVFLERIGAFVLYIPKEDFSVDDLAKLSSEEKNIIVRARKVFVDYQNFYFHKGGTELLDDGVS